MGDSVAFRKGVIGEIVARADGSAVEVCGLLLGDGEVVTAAVHCFNVADDPGRSFEIDPRQLLAAHRAARGGGPRILGCYHSHPDGAPTPSPRDAGDAAANGWLWLIAAGRAVGLYRAVQGGAWHGRFDAVTHADEG